MNATLTASGKLWTRVIRAPRAPLSWRIQNALRWDFIWGLIVTNAAKSFSKITGLPVAISELRLVLIHEGRRIDYGVVSRRCVTNNGVNFICTSWQGTQALSIMIYHGCGTGTNAENATDSALQTECTTALNPDNTRATGTKVASTNTLTSVGMLTFDAGAAVTEQGILSQAATGGGTLFDRSVFGAINVVSGDSIQFTYVCTFTAGG